MRYQTFPRCGAVNLMARIFPARAGFSPERTAGQTACPEEFPARARKVCNDNQANLLMDHYRRGTQRLQAPKRHDF
jgi:hypothetical protein